MSSRYWADELGYFVSFWLPKESLGSFSSRDVGEHGSLGEAVAIYGQPKDMGDSYIEILGFASTELDGYPVSLVESGEGMAYEFVFTSEESRKEFMAYIRSWGFKPSCLSYAQGRRPLGGPR